ncbi:Conserved_hypothetical protein [Hexamita inflata]|uniref:Protein 21.1 n=1 Tax=Hexamita inflata TaxID=28002 RepID=A0AA86PL66_9EUKA|nr:Conserved hypothetical protein [Hexamita inflata]
MLSRPPSQQHIFSYNPPSIRTSLPPIARLSNNYVKRKLIDCSPYGQPPPPPVSSFMTEEFEIFTHLRQANVSKYKQLFKPSNSYGITQLMNDLFVLGPSFTKELLNQGQIYERDVTGKTALHYATLGQVDLSVPIIKLSIMNKLLCQRDKNGLTALMMAAQLGLDQQIVMLQEEAGMQDNMGQTAIMHAIMHKNISSICILMEAEKLVLDRQGRSVIDYLELYKLKETVENALNKVALFRAASPMLKKRCNSPQMMIKQDQ